MSLFGWMQKAVVGGPENELKFAPEEKTLQMLDLHEALDAHANWKSRVERKLANPQFVFSAETVAADDQCKLGKWLHGAAQKMYGHLPEYKEARLAHTEFHASAAGVLTQYEAGNVDAAYFLLRGEFQHASDASQLALVKLFAAAQLNGLKHRH